MRTSVQKRFGKAQGISIGSSALLLAVAAVATTLTTTDRASAAANVWNGSGVSGGTSGTAWDDPANYGGGTATFSSANDLDFSKISVAGPTTLSSGGGTFSAANLLFGGGNALPAGTAEVLDLNGNGTLGGTTLNLNNNIIAPSTSASRVVLGDDLTLNLTNAAHKVQFSANSNVTTVNATMPVLVVNALVTGGGTGASFVNTYSQYGAAGTQSNTPAIILANNNNSFVAVENRFDSYVGYTSIGNVGGGNSAFGNASTAATGKIYLGNSGNLNYVGSGDQTTDRDIGVGSVNSFGNAAANTTVTFNSTFSYGSPTANALALRANVISNSTLVINGAITDNPGATSTPAGSVTKNGAQPYYKADGTTATNDGGGTLVLGGQSTYTGVTNILAGTLAVTNIGDSTTANALGKSSNAAASVLFSPGTTFKYAGTTTDAASTDRLFTLNGFNNDVGNVMTLDASGAGTVSFTNTGSIGWGVNNRARTLNFAGTNTGLNSFSPTLANNGTGAVAIGKSGLGTWALAGANSYGGTTSITGGTLLVNGTHTGAGTYTVASGGTLGGTGTISGATNASVTVQSGGKLAPGSASAAPLNIALSGTGALDISGAVGGSNTGGLIFDLGSTAASDKISLTSGQLKIGNGTLDFSDFAFTVVSGFPPSGGYVYTLFDTNSAISGTLASTGLTGSLGGTRTGTLSISGDGQDVLLTVNVPEPASIAVIGFAGAALLARRRRVK